MRTPISIIAILLFNITTSMSAQSNDTLIYVGDPMCSWCYGFSPELKKTVKALDDQVSFKMVMGGLRPYNTEQVNSMKDFLKGHWEHVNQASGQPFDYTVLDEGDFAYDTEPPSRAVLVVRKLKPDMELQFFEAVQRLFYVNGKNMSLTSTYSELVESMDIDVEQFKAEFESSAMKQAVRADFELAAKMGVRGFPSMVLKRGDQYYLLANGYTKADDLIKRIQQVD